MDEVQFWRGSPEQRALRTDSIKTGQYRYFCAQLGRDDWRGREVLDFGGNLGGLLRDDDCTIEHPRYCCLDVLSHAVAAGRERFPDARWVHYDRYNCSFNPQGVVGLPIPELGRFDTIVAYSVFTHTGLADMHELVEQLRGLLAPGGELAFTFIDPHAQLPDRHDGYRKDNLRWRLERNFGDDPSFDVEAAHARARKAQWCALLGNDDIWVEQDGDPSRIDAPCLSYHVYHTAAFMQSQFPDAEIRPPACGEMQHCCILRAP